MSDVGSRKTRFEGDDAASNTKRARLTASPTGVESTTHVQDGTAASPTPHRTLNCVSHRPQRASCGVLFDVMSAFRTTIRIRAIHVLSWSKSPVRPRAQVFCCRGSHSKSLFDRDSWQEVAQPTNLQHFPHLTKIPLSSSVLVDPGQAIGVYIHTPDNWGVSFALPENSKDVDKSRNGQSTKDSKIRVTLSRCAMSSQPFACVQMDLAASPGLFHGRIEYEVVAPSNGAKSNHADAKHPRNGNGSFPTKHTPGNLGSSTVPPKRAR